MTHTSFPTIPTLYSMRCRGWKDGWMNFWSPNPVFWLFLAQFENTLKGEKPWTVKKKWKHWRHILIRLAFCYECVKLVLCVWFHIWCTDIRFTPTLLYDRRLLGWWAFCFCIFTRMELFLKMRSVWTEIFLWIKWWNIHIHTLSMLALCARSNWTLS